MKAKNTVTVHAPLIHGQHAHHFFRVQFSKKRGICRYVAVKNGQDKDLFTLQDYGYYAAGVEAKKSYLNLMRHWRNLSPIPNWLLSPAQNWKMEMKCKLADTTTFDSRSSQLALLLGMIASQQKLPVQEIFATGELNNDGSSPMVEAVEGLSEKIGSIINYLKNEQPRHPVLIALPSKANPQSESQTEKLYSRRIESFLRQYSCLNIKVIYCENLLTDLTAHFPQIQHYAHPARYLKWIPIAASAAFGWYQYQQPLYLNWDNQYFQSEANRPLRGTLQPNNTLNILPLCPESSLGEDVFQRGDLMLMNVRHDDYSLLKSITSTHTALVMVGEKSGVRVENLPPRTDVEHLYQTAFVLQPPEEDYLIAAIAQRSFTINKGALNHQLIELIKEKQGIERLTTVAGFLEEHFSALTYRFRMTATCGDLQ